MAVLLGNLTLLVDAISPRTGLPDRSTRQAVLDVISNLPNKSKKDYSQLINNVCLSTKSFESDKEIRNFIFGVRKRVNSKANSVDFDAESSDEENSSGIEDVNENLDWEQQMRKRLKELEEMRELEKKAEELQSRMDDEEDEDDFKGENNDDERETEEQKRMRVRKELEKVHFLSLELQTSNFRTSTNFITNYCHLCIPS